jgi:hypothetical protein
MHQSQPPTTAAKTFQTVAMGMRRITPAINAADRQADAFNGLPDGITRWKLAAALRAAARKLDLNASMLALLEYYIDQTYDIDWAPGSEPIVCRPLVEAAEYLGRSERQVRNMETALMQRGLLAWRDSGNHHRKGRRDHRTGRLIYAYGPSLAPLGARATVILDVARQARAERGETRRLRLSISALRRNIRSQISLAADTGLDVTALCHAFAATPARNPAGTSLDALQRQRDALVAISASLTARIEPATGGDRSPEIAGKQEIAAHTHEQHSTKELMNEYQQRHSGAAPTRTALTPMRGIKPGELLDAAPDDIRLGLTGSDQEKLRDLIDKIPHHLLLYGVVESDWRFACSTLSRLDAAVCGIITIGAVEKSELTVEKPSAYFRSLVRYRQTNRLNAAKSLSHLAGRRRRRGPVSGRAPMDQTATSLNP